MERRFMREFNAEALKSGRVAILLTLIVWAGFTWFDVRLVDEDMRSAALVFRLLMVTPLLLAILAVLYTRYATRVYQTLLTAGLFFIFFILLSIYTYEPSKIIVLILIPFVIISLPTVWIGSLHVQRYARENYRAARLLARSMEQSESLLLNILPATIAQRLKELPGTIADGFNSVSVLFADIVGFTKLAELYEPEVLVQMLNRIFREFDAISRRYGVEKIKTIGDAYMLAAGVPEVRNNHCHLVARCALDMLAAAEHFRDPGDMPVRIRIGIHTGPAIAGVIGDHKFSYDLWGDTVNTASRMESHGDASRIQVTQDIYEKLKHDFVFEPRQEIEIKGKGRRKTWWLIGRRESEERTTRVE
ncbi:MAG: adenylate/guanylate cyclase domain-containing protein [Desulfatiglandales bacterium]